MKTEPTYNKPSLEAVDMDYIIRSLQTEDERIHDTRITDPTKDSESPDPLPEEGVDPDDLSVSAQTQCKAMITRISLIDDDDTDFFADAFLEILLTDRVTGLHVIDRIDLSTDEGSDRIDQLLEACPPYYDDEPLSIWDRLLDLIGQQVWVEVTYYENGRTEIAYGYPFF